VPSKDHINKSDRGMMLEGDTDSDQTTPPHPGAGTAGDADSSEGKQKTTPDKNMTQSKDDIYKVLVNKGFEIIDEVLK